MATAGQFRFEPRAKPPIGENPMSRFRAQLLRFLGVLLVGALVVFAAPRVGRAAALGGTDPGFRAFLTALWHDAERQGISQTTFNAAFAGVEPDPSILAHTQKQAEFVKPIGDYLTSAISAKRVEKGLGKAHDFEALLERIEKKWGVDRYVVLGVWGMETNFGGYTGDTSTVRALATLAYARYRGTFFRSELLTALKILQEGHVSPAQMRGSWAGAMGHTQFMPSSFMRYAVDFDGDGRKDIWNSVPDALASTANYLAHHGWVRDWTWGYEAIVPRGLTVQADPKTYHTFADWAAAGVRRADGDAMPNQGSAALIMPAGREGPAFLVTKNFQVIKSYNNSTSYALGVALLSDRVAGSGPLVASWPQSDTTATGSIAR